MEGQVDRHRMPSERDLAYEGVRDLILNGRLKPGVEVSQIFLSKTLSIGRSPIRDAISRLRNDGLVEYDARSRRWLVPMTSPQELDDLYAARLMLEPFVARLALESISDDSLRELRDSFEASTSALESQDMDIFQCHHRVFHLVLAKSSGDWSHRIIENLWDLAERYRRLMFADSPGELSVRTTIAQHRSIMDAVIARDGEALSYAIAVHLGTTARRLFVMFGPRFRPAAVELALEEKGLSLWSSTGPIAEALDGENDCGEFDETA